MILIVTICGDIHAEAIKFEINNLGSVRCEIFEMDRISAQLAICWGLADEDSYVVLSDGSKIYISDVDLVWWRRSRSDQRLDFEYDPGMEDLINQDCRAALYGLLATKFKGGWISHPDATLRASNKLVQLKAAHSCGMIIPKTIISNDPVTVRAFLASVDKCIAKPAAGTKHALLFTQFVDEAELDDDSIRACPAIYQEYVSGDKHLRVNVFGDYVCAAEIVTSELDWRRNVEVSYGIYEVPAELVVKLREVLSCLELEMGVVDVKITPRGEFVWFEVNPQGQFLFLEGMANIPVRKIFATYLIEKAKAYHRQSYLADEVPLRGSGVVGSP